MAPKAKVQPTNPYLTVKGAADAIAFYQKAFGAKELTRMHGQDGKRRLDPPLPVPHHGGNGSER